MRIEFTQSSRRHKVGRARIRAVLSTPFAVHSLAAGTEHRLLELYLGDDLSGRALEVIVVRETDRLVVIHAMDLRPKYRAIYENGRQ